MNNFFDLQVNGYAGTDFNRPNLTAEALHTICLQLQNDGVAGALATIITEDLEVMSNYLQRVVELREKDELARRIIVGFHIEGPFINPADYCRGAHPADAIVPTHLDAMKRLLEAADGLTKLVTLAPEWDENFQVTRFLSEQNIAVSAGHCDPTLSQLEAACDAGLSLYTHLGNGTFKVMPRHDNIIQRVLSLSDRLRICFIADGLHVPFFALKNYLRCAGVERAIIVTDAVAPTGAGPGNYTFSRVSLNVGEDLVARSPATGSLAGAIISMRQSAANLEKLGFSGEEVRWLTERNPRLALGL